MNKPVIGVCGTFASGKDTLAHILEDDYGFMHVSTSDIVREKSMERHGSIERNPYLQETATYFRKEYGGDYFEQEAYRRFLAEADTYQGVVISGLRSIGAGKAIKAKGGTLVFIDAPIEVRYERMVSRQRDAETHMTLDEFKASEAREKTGSQDDAAFNLDALRDMADIRLENASTYEAFNAACRGLLHDLGIEPVNKQASV